MAISIEQHIDWEEFVEPTRFRTLRWRNGLEPNPDDPRSDVINYVLMNNKVADPIQVLSETEQLHQTGQDSYISTTPENTATSGLMRVVDFCQIKVPEPKELLLVGSMDWGGIGGIVSWLDKHNWRKTHITVVDKEPLPLALIGQLIRSSILKWPAGVDFIHCDVRDLKPEKLFDTVVADILNPYADGYYAFPSRDKVSPYLPYEGLLKQIKSFGREPFTFISRCFTIPQSKRPFSHYPKPMHGAGDTELEKAWNQLQNLHPFVDKEEVLDTPGTFAGSFPPVFCGLYKQDKTYRPKSIITGDHAIEVYKRLHCRHFPGSRCITVRDSNNRTFLNFVWTKG